LRALPLHISALSTTTQIMAQPTPAMNRQASQLQNATVMPSPTQPAAKSALAR